MKWRNATCVVLCAGRGNRLLPFSLEKPKAMLEIKEKPILSYVIDYWKRYTDSFVFVVRYKKEEIIKYAGKLPLNVSFVEQGRPRGIADAIFRAKNKVSRDFIVVLGDCICRGKFSFPPRMEQGVGIWKTAKPQDIKQSFSIEIENKIISRVEEKPRIIRNNLCGMGFYFFNQKVFNYIKLTAPSRLRNEVEITDVIQNMISADEKISPVFFKGDYLNITYAEDLRRAQLIFAKKER